MDNGLYLIASEVEVFLGNHIVPPSVAFIAQYYMGTWTTTEGNEIFSNVKIIMELDG